MLCDSTGLSGCRQDKHQAVVTAKAFPESSPCVLFTSGLVPADIYNKKKKTNHLLQVGIIPALTSFNEVEVEE